MPHYRLTLPQFRRPTDARGGGGIRGLVRTGDEDGFSIIEILVAIGIFAVIAALMSTTLASGLRGVLLGKRREVATQEANRMLEITRALSYDAIGLVSSDATINTDSAIQTHGGKKSYLTNATWEPLIFAVNPTGHPFNPHVQNLARGSTELVRSIYVTGVDADANGTNELKRVTVRVAWTAAGTGGSDNEVRAQTLVNASGIVPIGSGGNTAPLTAKATATAGSLNVSSSLLGLNNIPLDVTLPVTTGSSTFRAVSNTNCTTKSASIKALNLIDLDGYSVTTTADDDSRTAVPSAPADQSSTGVLSLSGPVGTLLGPVINSPVSCHATTTPMASETGTGSALSVLNANTSVPLLNLLGIPILPPWLLNLANVQVQPVTQTVNHEVVSGQREILATAGGSTAAVDVLKIAGVLPNGLFHLDAITYGASVRGAAGTPSAAPTITSPTISLRVFDTTSQLGAACAGATAPGITATRSHPYCVLTINPAAAGFVGKTIELSSSFLQGLGILQPIVNLSYGLTLNILPATKSPLNGQVGPNGEKRWAADYTPISLSASLDATLLGIPIIDANIGLNLGGVQVEACAGATCS